MTRRASKGISIIELLITMVVFLVVAQALSLLFRGASVQNVALQDRAFAVQKAVQMLEELRSLVNAEGTQVTLLDDYIDGWDSATKLPLYKFTLTTERDVTHNPGTPPTPKNDWQTAATPLSGNPLKGGAYKYVRHVEIQKGNDPSLRRIVVRVFAAAPNSGSSGPSPALARDPTDRPLAEVAAVVNSLGPQAFPVQVHDVYLIALENMPGWWARVSKLRPLMDATLINLQARNRGLRIREHWIRRISYGRDLEYAPEINSANLATAANAFTRTYVYPGKVTFDAPDGVDLYYDPAWIDGRVIEDGAVPSSRVNYPLADQFNHAMRYPDELRMYEIHKRLAANRGDPATPEISLRMLWELLHSNDPALRGAIVINLHGELVPLVPLRNVSDPAKDPLTYYVGAAPKTYRAAAHPEQLHFNSLTGGAEPVEEAALRVYAWQAVTGTAAETDRIDVVTLFVPNGKLDNFSRLDRLEGSSTVSYKWLSVTAAAVTKTAGVWHDGATALTTTSRVMLDEYTTAQNRAGLRIRLFGVSTTARSYLGYWTGVSPTSAVYQGLTRASQLYQLEYMPFPVNSAGADSFRDLGYPFTTTATAAVIKNTSRYRIVFKDLTATAGTEVAVETRLGVTGSACVTGYLHLPDYASATTFMPPFRASNLSTTYFWLNQADPPITERSCPVGDPRLIPYRDMTGHAGQPATTRYKDRYNWFFKDLRTAASAGPDYRANLVNWLPQAKWTRYNGQNNFDVPRLFQVWRDSVLNSRSVYNSLTGWSNYYVGLGGEIGGDANNKLAGGVPMSAKPWGATTTPDRDELILPASLVRSTTGAGNPWFGLSFMGELWPDAFYATEWASTLALHGNLRNNQSGGNWRRDSWSNCDNASYTLADNWYRTSGQGCGSFMNGVTNFNHYSQNGYNAPILYDGVQMGEDFNFPMSATFPAWRPWGLNAGNTQPERAEAEYASSRLNLQVYSASSQPASSLGFYARAGAATDRSSATVRLVDTSGKRAGFMVINGLSPSTDAGVNFVARFAILSCLRTFHDAGVPQGFSRPGYSFTNNANFYASEPYRIEPVPLVQVVKPDLVEDLRGQAALEIVWKERYARWDGRRYNENYPCLDVDDPSGPCSPQVPALPEDPAFEWHSPEPLGFTLRYSEDGGASYRSAVTGLTVTTGAYAAAEALTFAASAHVFTWNWNVSSLPAGTKFFRVECFRRNLGLNYSYHEVPLQVSP